MKHPTGLRGLLYSFGYAFWGISTLIRTQRNARIHVLAVAVVIVAGWRLGLERSEWLAAIVICSLVLALEALNTAIEATVDLASPEFHPLAKRAKDLAAAAVLIAALGALAVAGVIVGARL